MKTLSKQQIILLHEHMIQETGGAHGLRDEGMLDSALAAPFQEVFGTVAYPSIQQKAVRLGYGLIMNHPFVDGNKRIGTHAMLVLLALNGIELQYEQDELSDEILAVASRSLDYEQLLQWIIDHQT
ncbi:MAG: type II toxin-antitoxin system death-on-curing family toxin [Firmicutes bacterium]|nr:type II toxin-antitoxin system death-on-curing family toxin [Bacillota bacterium]